MKLALFLNDSNVANCILNSLIPQIIGLGYEPVLFKNRAAESVKAQLKTLQNLSLQESKLLGEVVEPYMINASEGDALLTDKSLAKKYGLGYYEVEDVNSPEFIDMVNNDKSIVGGISMRFYKIFKSETIKAFKEKGFLWNLHTGLLPKYKGVYIPYRSIENKESHYGWTLHEVDEGIDTGGILSMDQNLLDPEKPILNTYLDMVDKGVSMMMGALMFYSKHKRSPVPVSQKTDHESYFTFPTEIEMQRWTSQGIRFSDDIVQMYLNLYTMPNTPERSALKNKLEKAISEFEHQEFQGITITKGQLAA